LEPKKANASTSAHFTKGPALTLVMQCVFLIALAMCISNCSGRSPVAVAEDGDTAEAVALAQIAKELRESSHASDAECVFRAEVGEVDANEARSIATGGCNNPTEDYWGDCNCPAEMECGFEVDAQEGTEDTKSFFCRAVNAEIEEFGMGLLLGERESPIVVVSSGNAPLPISGEESLD